MALIKPLAPSLQKQHNALMFCLSKERRVRLQCKYAHTASVPDNEGPILHEGKGGGVIIRSTGLPVGLLVSVTTDWIFVRFFTRCCHTCVTAVLCVSFTRASQPLQQTASRPRSARAHRAAILPREEPRPRGGAAMTKSPLHHTPM